MKEIKFRGVKTHGGGYVYGDLSHDGGRIYINDKCVKPEPIDLLVGYDKDGDEIYEGDMLIDKFGGTFEAGLEVTYCGKTHHFTSSIGGEIGLKKFREAPYAGD